MRVYEQPRRPCLTRYSVLDLCTRGSCCSCDHTSPRCIVRTGLIEGFWELPKRYDKATEPKRLKPLGTLITTEYQAIQSTKQRYCSVSPGTSYCDSDPDLRSYYRRRPT